MEAKADPYPLCEVQPVNGGDRSTLTPPSDVMTSFLTVKFVVQPGPSATAGSAYAAASNATNRGMVRGPRSRVGFCFSLMIGGLLCRDSSKSSFESATAYIAYSNSVPCSGDRGQLCLTHHG